MLVYTFLRVVFEFNSIPAVSLIMFDLDYALEKLE